MGITLIRSLLLYIVVVFSVRLMGKRQLGELQPSELVITILISNIATLPLEDINIPIFGGVLPILALVCFEVIMSWVTLKSKKVRRLVSGSPKIIIRNGTIDQQTLKELRLSVDDLMTELRENQVFTPDDVQAAIVETTGNISLYLKAEKRPLTQEDIQLHQPSYDPPTVVLADGEVNNAALRSIGKDANWLQKQLQKNSLTPQQTFLVMADVIGDCTVIAKDKRCKK